MNAPDPFRPSADGSVLDLPAAVTAELESFLRTQTHRLAGLGPGLSPLLDAAKQAVRGGKRLRAAYCYWGWRAAGGAPGDDRVLRAAAALEWLQAAALVHDDLVDGSDTRRGRPAAHRAFAHEHRAAGWRGDPDRYGAGGAILLGDLMLAWSGAMFHGCGLPAPALHAAGPFFDACTAEVMGGQFLDLVAQFAGPGDVEDAMRVVRYKAAGYTVERPLHVGAALAGADADLIEALTRFGVPVGEAFQLRDDVLGVFGDPAVTGKPAGDDLREGKRTVLLAEAIARSDEPARATINQLVGDEALDEAGVERLRDIVVASGALGRVEVVIAELEESARQALAKARVDDQTRDSLQALADLSTRRTR